MAKKGPLGKAECFYIDHHYQSMTADDIASELDRTVKSIETYVKKNHSTKNKSAINAADQILHKKGTTVMTENASSIIDENRKPKSLNKDCIFKIKPDKWL